MSENGTEKKIGYRDILGQKEYMKIIVANLINRFGDSIDAIAFTWLVYAVTGSASWTAVIFGLNQIPSVVLQPLQGRLSREYARKAWLWRRTFCAAVSWRDWRRCIWQIW